jgi:hypothetical protein
MFLPPCRLRPLLPPAALPRAFGVRSTGRKALGEAGQASSAGAGRCTSAAGNTATAQVAAMQYVRLRVSCRVHRRMTSS